MYYIGIDAHKKSCQATVMDDGGRIVERKKIPTGVPELKEFFSRYRKGRAVVEACPVWEIVYEAGRGAGVEVILANPGQVKAISQARVKTDKVDSETLAHLLRTDMVPESYIAPTWVRELRRDLRGRIHLQKTIVGIRNQLYSEMMRKGVKYKSECLKTKKGKDALRETLPVPRILRRLDILEGLETELKDYNSELLLPAFYENEKAQLLATIDGVGFYTSMTVVAELGDVNRFPDSDSVVSYTGLAPWVRQSGSTSRTGSITKTGPHNLRWVLVEATHSHLRFCKSKEECRLCQFHRRIETKHKGKVAVVATAAKLLRIMYWMLKLNRPYQPQGLDPGAGHEGEPRASVWGKAPGRQGADWPP
jgi:transposase